MTLNQLRAFLASARCGSFTAAARDLQISQAAVSELIRRLEQEHGVVLFHRGRRALVLTSAGQEPVPHAEQAVLAADNAGTLQAALVVLPVDDDGLIVTPLARDEANGAGDTFTSRAVASSAACPPAVGIVSFDPPIYDTIALVRRENRPLSPATREIARLAQQMLHASNRVQDIPGGTESVHQDWLASYRPSMGND